MRQACKLQLARAATLCSFTLSVARARAASQRFYLCHYLTAASALVDKQLGNVIKATNSALS